MPYSRELDLAERAVTYVEQTLPFGAENKPIDMAHREMRGQHPLTSIFRYSYRNEIQMPDFYLLSPCPRFNINKIRLWSRDAKVAQQGLCGEQTAVAFDYLISRRPRTSVANIRFDATDPDLNFNHTIVVLGLPSEPPWEQYWRGPLIPADWQHAVWCDPWAQDWFEIKEGWPRRVHGILRQLKNGMAALNGLMRISCYAYYDDRY